MLKKFKELDTEVKLAGIFGIVAIVAIIVEMALGGFAIESIAAGIKDFAGTIVAVLVFFIAAKALTKDTPKNFLEYYEKEMVLLIDKYNPLLSKTDVKADYECYDLNTNAGALYGDAGGRKGRFCEMQKDNYTKITFSLNYTTFGFKAKNEVSTLKLQLIGQKVRGFLKSFVGNKFKNKVSEVQFDEKNLNIIVSFSSALQTQEDAKMLSEIIDCVLMNYLILSGREITITDEN